jgi:hypothetical protein
VIQFFPSFNLGDASVVAMLAVMWWRLGSVEKKMEKMTPQDVTNAKADGLQKQINGLHHRIDMEAN